MVVVYLVSWEPG